MNPLINLISRVFLAVALCVSTPVAFADDSSYDIDKERIAQEIREKAMSGDLKGARWRLVELEHEHKVRTLGYDWGQLLLDRRAAYWKDPKDLMSIVGISEALHKGADVNQVVRYGPRYNRRETTALEWAVRSGDHRMAAILLDSGADIETGTAWGRGKTKLILFPLLYSSYYFLSPSNVSPATILRKYYEPTIRTLLLYGADVNARYDKFLMSTGVDRGDNTPLHYAAMLNASGIARILINHGADINARNEYGETPLHMAAELADTAAYSAEGKAEMTEIVNILLDNGADIDAENKWGRAPLIYTMLDPSMAYFSKALIERGADVNTKSDGDITPLHYAAMWWRSEAGPEVVKLLIAHGADVNAKIIVDGSGSHLRYVGYTPLDFAARSNAESAKILRDNGAYCNVTTWDLCGEPPEPKADYTGLYANAAFAVAGAFAPSWVDTQTFAFNEGDKLVTGQSLSVPLDDFTFAAKRVQVNDLTDYEFAVKWEMEF